MEVLHQGQGLEVLPTEVLEMVLCQLPLPDLLATHALVCSRWASLILSPAFIPWKKLYHQLKQDPSISCSAFLLSPKRMKEKVEVREVVDTLCAEHQVTSLQDCLISIIRLMGAVQRAPQGAKVSQVLEPHQLYSLALATLNHLHHSLPTPFNVWHIATTIILLSTTVWEVEKVLLLLLRGSFFTAPHVVEAFYCLASLLLHSHRTHRLPPRYHYIVFYALYLYENGWSGAPRRMKEDAEKESRVTHVGQQSLHNYLMSTSTVQHTHQQMRIINHHLQPHHVVKVVALAGTGKTTTLLQLCQRSPHLKYLLLVYNKSVAEHCSLTFPPNVKVKTAHSMAYAAVGRRYGAIRKLEGSLNASKVAYFLDKKERAGNRYTRASLVKNTLDRFLNGPDPFLTLAHVPTTNKEGGELDHDFRLRVLLDDAEKVWSEMKTCSPSQKLPMSQDGQLKQWQLSGPRILGYEVILVDEGQDMNAAMLDIFLSQSCAKVIVGDPYQQIYSFRGAVNALQQVTATHTFFLTQSFRFGPEISFMANCILENLLKVSKQTLVGGRKKDSIVRCPDPRKYEGQGRQVRRAYLARSNLELYKVALSLCCNEDFKDVSMGFAGGLQKYGFDTVMSIYKLAQMEAGYGDVDSLQINDKLVAKFSSVQGLFNFAEKLDDNELLNKIKMYKYSGSKTPKHLSLLNERCSCNPSTAKITFSTIHKSKGLEWDWVILLDDINATTILMREERGEFNVGDEYNLLYVSVTRAKKYLTLNSAALYTLISAKEKLEVLRARADVQGEAKCVQCGGSIDQQSSPLITYVPELQLSYTHTRSISTFSSGFFCSKCASFTSFHPALTTRHPSLRTLVMADCGRVARQGLLMGGTQEPGLSPNQHFPAQQRGWHEYRSSSGREADAGAFMGDSDEEVEQVNEIELIIVE